MLWIAGTKPDQSVCFQAPADPASVEPRFGNYKNKNVRRPPSGFMPVEPRFENSNANLHPTKLVSGVPTKLEPHDLLAAVVDP